MMEPFFTILGREIPVYGVFYFFGIGIAVLAAIFLSRGRLPSYEIVYSAVYTVLGAVAGAKILFIAVSFPEILALKIPFLSVLKGGFVFYGGLIGGIVGLLLYCKQFHLPFFSFADLYAAVLPLGHAFGRLGCFFAGCCYGMPYVGPFSVTYHQTLGDTPLNIPLFPIQLLEAVALIVLFVLCSVLYRKRTEKNKGKVAGMYAVVYAVLRFFLEYFRGDGVRGFLWNFSTSQWISLFLFAFGLCILFSKRSSKRKKAD